MYIINALVYTDRQEFAPLTVQTRGEQIIALLPLDAALETHRDAIVFRDLPTFIFMDAMAMISVTELQKLIRRWRTLNWSMA